MAVAEAKACGDLLVAGRVWRSSGRLADGREIIYFDESPGLGRADAGDGRDLAPAGMPSDGPVAGQDSGPGGGLRWDPLLGEWVMFATGRRGRPVLPPAGLCPLCPSRPGRRTEIPAPGYDVVVFENRFPVLGGAAAGTARHAADPGPAPATGPRPGTGPLPLAQRPGHGRCEVICFTAEHDASFASLSLRRVRTVLAAWADRTRVLGAMPGVRHVYCFENRGEEVGVTLHHPHGQVYAFPFVPPRTRRLLTRARAHRARTGRNLFDDLVAGELADGRRIVARNEHWIAFVPPAPRWPYEVMLFPAARIPDLPVLRDPVRAAFGPVYRDVLRRLDGLFGAPMPYIAAWQQAPVRGRAARAEFALHLQVLPVGRGPGEVKFLAGTESAAGVWSNDVLPEMAALRLRHG
ncbi:MAG: galactose-1-phosphate uridylyltransferase [Actinobacteria bacterium]|nr:galactose-1-phosphate uridylyltransferase [Actinomycetota bacterium]